MKSLLRPAALALATTLALAGCAINHSDDFVSLVSTQEAAPKPTLLTNVDIVLVSGQFGDITDKGKSAPGMAMLANRQLRTLGPALRTQLPLVLQRNGIHAQLMSNGDPHRADQVMTIQPRMAQDSHSANGQDAGVGLQFTIEIRERGGALIWRGKALERPSPSRPETMQWSDATAEDLARTLLIRLRREGFVRLGANGDADPV